MLSRYISSIIGVEVFGIIGLFIFFTMFLIILYRTFKLKANYIDYMQRVPLTDDADPLINTESPTDDSETLTHSSQTREKI